MSESAIRVVCFDLGGVVVRICRSWAEGFARAGVELREPGEFERFEFLERRHELTDAYMSGRIESGVFFGAIAEAFGGVYSVDELRAVHDAWIIEEYPGVADLVSRLGGVEGGAGVSTACLSNTNDAHWKLLCDGTIVCPAIGHLDTVMVSHKLGAVKPDEAIFRKAELILGARPAEIVFFDDVPAYVEGARVCGWNAFAIDHEGDPARQIEDRLGEIGVL